MDDDAGTGIFICLIVLVLIALIPATIAARNGRNFALWWLYGVALWIVALIHSILLTSDRKAVEARALGGADSKKCPFCAELIKPEAVVCRFCGRDVPPAEPSIVTLAR